MIKFRKLNDEIVKPIPIIGQGLDKRDILGEKLFPELYANIYLIARKNSGKTSTVFKIIKECVDRNTKVIAFVSTLNKDKNWKAIKDYCEKKKIEFEGHTSIFEDGNDILNDIVTNLQNETKDNEKDNKEIKKEKFKSLLLCDSDSDDEDDSKPRKSKFKSPEYLFIFDDLSGELKSKSLITLLKKNRHFLSKIIISSQYPLDLDKQSRKQIDNWLVFGSQPKDKLEVIHSEADINISLELFEDIYKSATEEKYSFLYVDTRNDTFRKNFNYQIVI